MPDIERLTKELNDFDPVKRRSALLRLAALATDNAFNPPEAVEVANMHCHTFFSFNAYGFSPSRLAWLAKERGYKLMGIVDFDVLDGVDEFLDACHLLNVRGSAGLETRLYLPEYGERVINSPGEPGVLYHMGVGFTSSRVPESAAGIIADLRARARARNRSMVERVNAHLAPVTIDYEQDVLPLTPNGNATERHLVQAYIRAAQRLSEPAAFWAEKLDEPREKVERLMGPHGDAPGFQNLVRARLMKRGGVGYVQPGPGSFLTIDRFHALIEACAALPCAAWLDGLSEGEQAMPELLDFLVTRGVVVLNIIPDRNWNIADTDLKRVKLRHLYEVVELARDFHLPLHVGTEMNSFGNKFIDDFDAPELAPVRDAFLEGAYFIYGHVMLQKWAGLGYQSAWAKTHFPDRGSRNAFFTRAGRLIPPGERGANALKTLDSNWTPRDVLRKLDAHSNLI